jgi:hypothetical protein
MAIYFSSLQAATRKAYERLLERHAMEMVTGGRPMNCPNLEEPINLD